MDSQKIKKLIDEALSEESSLFLIDYNISDNGHIEVIIDGDKGVPLNECVRVSRHIEHNLDRETEDFSLQVTTPDITKPIVHKRQYIKNIGRTLKVKTDNEEIQAKLMDLKEDILFLEWKAREPKPIGKGKHTVVKKAEIPIDNIEKAIVKIVF